MCTLEGEIVIMGAGDKLSFVVIYGIMDKCHVIAVPKPLRGARQLYSESLYRLVNNHKINPCENLFGKIF